MELLYRPAEVEDCEVAVPLIYSSGPEILDHCFARGGSPTADFLAAAFVDGRGFFGWRNHTAVVVDGQVAGIGAFYSGGEHGRLSRGLIAQIFQFYTWPVAPRVLRRATRLKTIMPAPSRTTHYAANLGVRPELRGLGIGAALLAEQERVARRLRRSTFALDVAANNPRAQALYERLGFAVTRYQASPCPPHELPSCRRMERPVMVLTCPPAVSRFSRPKAGRYSGSPSPP